MMIFETIDTEHHRRDISLCKPMSGPDATGFSGAEPNTSEAEPSSFLTDYSEEHSSPRKSAPTAKLIGCIASQKPALSRGKGV
jgi:hypothetical protein